MTRPRKSDFPTWFSWRQADEACLRRHGGPIWSTALLVLVIGLLSGNAAVLLILSAVAVAGTIYARSMP